MKTDNTRDAAEPSLASAGSQPVGWGAVASDGSVVCMMRRRADVASYVVDGTPIVPLYRSPTLTDEEREAIEWASTVEWGSNPHAATLRGLLERLG
jgi:hypothetical protein